MITMDITAIILILATTTTPMNRKENYPRCHCSLPMRLSPAVPSSHSKPHSNLYRNSTILH